MEIDEALLGGEDESDCDDFEITNEKEEALLQDDEEYSKSKDVFDDEYSKSRNVSKEPYSKFRDRYDDDDDDDVDDDSKKDSMSDIAEDDILNLDIEEDFQDVDEKTICEDQTKKEITENIQNIKSISDSPLKNTEIGNQSAIATKRINNNAKSMRNPAVKKVPQRNDNWRKRGNGRGNFQNRSNFGNNSQRRRNGTVLINPRYEGTVQINENSARPAWDNSQYPPNNTKSVQPWTSGSYNANLATQVLKNILVQSGNLLIPPIQSTPQNYYQPPNEEKPLMFEPPPNIQEQTCPPPFIHQQQVSNRHMYPSTQPNMSSLPSYQPRGKHHFNSQLPNYGMKRNNQAFNSYSNYGQTNRPNYQQNYSFQANKNENRNFAHKWSSNRPGNFNNNSTSQNNNQNKNSFNRSNSYQNNYTSYGNNGFKRGGLKNVDMYNNYERRDSSENYRPLQSFADSSTSLTGNSGNFNSDQNLHRERFQPLELPEKKARLEESTTKSAGDDCNKLETKLNTKPTNITTSMEEEEDEETRLYLLKIEEQKKERERVLQTKEERRKQMMLQQQKRDEENLNQHINENSATKQTSLPNTTAFKHSAGTEQEHYSNLAAPVQRLVQQQSSQNPAKPFAKHFQGQKQCLTSKTFAQRANQYFPPSTLPQRGVYDSDSSQISLTAEVSNDASKVSDFKVIVQDKVLSSVPKTEASSSSFMSNRVVVVKSKNKESPPIVPSTNEASKQSSDVDQGLSSFLNNRKVSKKDTSLLNTRRVVVNNLSTTINPNKLRALTRGIGEIKELHVDTQERQATILFETVASAHAFFKKNRRRILDDLSVIEVKLEPTDDV